MYVYEFVLSKSFSLSPFRKQGLPTRGAPPSDNVTRGLSLHWSSSSFFGETPTKVPFTTIHMARNSLSCFLLSFHYFLPPEFSSTKKDGSYWIAQENVYLEFISMNQARHQPDALNLGN